MNRSRPVEAAVARALRGGDDALYGLVLRAAKTRERTVRRNLAGFDPVDLDALAERLHAWADAQPRGGERTHAQLLAATVADVARKQRRDATNTQLMKELLDENPRNPLRPGAYADESAPCALVRPVGGLPFDDRAGVHVTDDWGLALRYAAFKAAKSESIAVVLTYDMKGLELEPDFDAKVEQKHSMLGESSWYIEEFDILENPDDPDYDKLADVLQGEVESREDDAEGPPWSAQSELIRLSRTPIEAVVAEHLREGEPEARVALEAVAAGTAPLEYHAEAICQWRTFSEVGDDRLLRVEVVRPFYDTVSGDDEEEADEESPLRLQLEDLDDIPAAVETETLFKRAPKRGAEVYYHGTDLTRAEVILGDADIELYNPWAPLVQPED